MILSPKRASPSATGSVAMFHRRKVTIMKSCKLCKYSKVCNDLPAVCILIPYVAVALVTVSMGYLFVTQELL
jgi:hypothetical protein